MLGWEGLGTRLGFTLGNYRDTFFENIPTLDSTDKKEELSNWKRKKLVHHEDEEEERFVFDVLTLLASIFMMWVLYDDVIAPHVLTKVIM